MLTSPLANHTKVRILTHKLNLPFRSQTKFIQYIKQYYCHSYIYNSNKLLKFMFRSFTLMGQIITRLHRPLRPSFDIRN